MTASSVQFLSSQRVQLVGMPQGVSNRPLPIRDTRTDFLRDSHALTPQRISRNLFGAPKAGEIGELLVKETAQRRSNFLQRYNFDILCPHTVPCSESKSVASLEVSQSERLPELIEKELLDQEKRLSGEVINTCKSAKSKLQLSNQKSLLKQSEQAHKQNGSCAISESTTTGVTTEASSSLTKLGLGDSSERLKPYSRQTFITDCYSLRKTNIGRSNKAAISIVVSSHQHKLDVVPLPKSIRAAKSESLSSSATSTDLTNEESTSEPIKPLPYK